MIYKFDSLVETGKTYSEVAIGYFDGVHKGHQQLLKNLNKETANLIITLEREGENIMTIPEKAEHLQAKYNADVIILNLGSADILNTSKEEFIAYLQNLGVQKVVVGEDFNFGYKASGNIKDLSENFKTIVQPLLKNKENLKISSTNIREYLKKGNIKAANEELGYNYYITGEVIKGNQIGRTLNFPTINQQYQNCLLPNGIYTTKTIINNQVYGSVTNIGVRPTIDNIDRVKVIETHIYGNFNQEIYGENVKVEFINYIRGEEKFNGLEELKIAIANDVKIAKKENGDL